MNPMNASQAAVTTNPSAKPNSAKTTFSAKIATTAKTAKPKQVAKHLNFLERVGQAALRRTFQIVSQASSAQP
jgi:hypothetical protein